METNYKFKELKDFKKAHPNLYKVLYNRSELEKLCIDMDWPNHLSSLASEQEHEEFIKENNIKNGHLYSKLYKKSELKLHSSPWIKFGNGKPIDYFDKIWGKDEYASEQEHINFIKENNIKRSGKLYSKLYKTSDLKLHSNPWRKFGNISRKDYFDKIWGEIASEQEHEEFIKENNIKNGHLYSKLYKKSELKLHSNPWRKFGNISRKDYFDKIWGKDDFASEQEHINFIKENNIKKASNRYNQLYKTSDLKLHSTPWVKFGNGKSKDYFENIWGEPIEYASEQEHEEFIKENNIKSGHLYSKLYKTSKLKLHSNPWRKFNNGKTKDYFDKIWGNEIK